LPGRIDINRHHHTSDEADDPDRPTLVVGRSEDRRSFRFDYRDGTRFLVEDLGARVWARWPPPLTPEDTATYLLGPVLGFVLRLRGHVCLHASSIVVDGGAVAFTGPSGAGKSTLAAALVALGHQVLTEDVTRLHLEGGRFWVEPGCPVIRLWQSSVQPLFGAPDAMPLLTPNWDKRFQPLSSEAGNFMSERCPLRVVYVMDVRRRFETTTRIRRLSSCEALLELVRNTYSNQLLDTEMRAREFALLGELVAKAQVRALQFADDFECLPRVCSDILADVACAEQSAAVIV
jgi:energy-coupling factor transporter ATP-binding protein EcfA2